MPAKTKNPNEQIADFRERRRNLATERAELEGEIAGAKSEQFLAGTKHLERDIAEKQLRVNELRDQEQDVGRAVMAVMDANPAHYEDEAHKASKHAAAAQEVALAALEDARAAFEEASDRWQVVREIRHRTGSGAVGYLPTNEFGKAIEDVRLRLGGNHPWPGGRRPGEDEAVEAL